MWIYVYSPVPVMWNYLRLPTDGRRGGSASDAASCLASYSGYVAPILPSLTAFTTSKRSFSFKTAASLAKNRSINAWHPPRTRHSGCQEELYLVPFAC